jgi:signal transduction histidine kinase
MKREAMRLLRGAQRLESLPVKSLSRNHREHARRDPTPSDRALFQGISAARWAVWGWAAFTTIVQRKELDHPIWAAAFLVLSFSWAALCTTWLRTAPAMLTRAVIVVTEVVLAWSLLLVDGAVYKGGHSFGEGQNLAGNWPLMAVLAAATAIGPWWGAALAVFVASGRLFGGIANGTIDWSFHSVDRARGAGHLVSIASTMVFYAVAAIVWGAITRRLRVVENEVAAQKARDDVARTLHDGVLQTLALVERRTKDTDPELAAVARTSDRDLRAWLFHGGAASEDEGSLGTRVHRVADRIARTFDLPVTVSVVDALEDDLAEGLPDPLTEAMLSALCGAVGESLTNAAKHADATKVIVFAERDDDGRTFISVRDNGKGFNPATSNDSGRRGVAHSIHKRMDDVGGRSEIVSTPTEGTEVRLWSHQ